MGNGMLSQEEIDALLRGTFEPDPPAVAETAGAEFGDMEKDAIGEIANISMGTAATTLSLLLGRKVEITTPRVDLTSVEQIREDYPIPSVIVDVKYKAGIKGSNLLILSQRDGAVIVDLMMGGDGTNPSSELNELQISGISEAMNQMMGSAATSMSTMFHSLVDITPPNLVLNNLAEEQNVLVGLLNADEPLVRISFRMVVGTVIDSILIQVVPLSVAKGMVAKLLGGVGSAPVAAAAELGAEQRSSLGEGASSTVASLNMSAKTGWAGQNDASSGGAGMPNIPGLDYGIGNGGTPVYGAPSNGAYPPGTPPHGGAMYGVRQPTSVQPVQFAPLQSGQVSGQPTNLGLILDVPLQVSVELGKAKKTIKEILEMGPGSVIELDRLAGEPVDMIVNGKLIAKCEVVVINETFGIRITDIVHPAERMQSIG